MSKITLSPNISGTGVFTVASPATNTDRTLTLPDKAGTFATTDDTIGVGQTWQNVTGSRVLGTTYTNSTGRPITLWFEGVSSSGSSAVLVLNGVSLSGSSSPSAARSQFTVIIPNGNTYAVTLSGSSSVVWMELR